MLTPGEKQLEEGRQERSLLGKTLMMNLRRGITIGNIGGIKNKSFFALKQKEMLVLEMKEGSKIFYFCLRIPSFRMASHKKISRWPSTGPKEGINCYAISVNLRAGIRCTSYGEGDKG